MQKRIVVFTAGAASAERLALLSRIAGDADLRIAAIFVDQYSLRSAKRMKFLIKKWGLAEWALSLAAVAKEKLCELHKPILQKWHDLHIKPKPSVNYRTFGERYGIPVHFVSDINSPLNIELVKKTNADLGIIIGGRILHDRIATLPKHGTLNIHGHDARKYRGGAQIGYPERLNSDTHLGITVHLATSKVDAGDIIAYREIPIEKYDNDKSLALKEGAAGVELYFEAIKGYLDQTLLPQKQDLSQGQTYYSTPHFRRAKLWNPIRKKMWRDLKKENPRNVSRILQFVFSKLREVYFWIMLPLFAQTRKKLEQQGRAPVVIIYYHGVGNGAENWMTLPVEALWEQYRYAQKYYDVITLEEAVRRLKSGRNDRAAVVFTYDDGYRSCYKNLLPLCQTHNLPATLFVCAEASQKGLRLSHDVDKGYKNAELLSPEEIRYCHRAGLEVGSHTMRHEVMSKLSEDEARRVFVESKRILTEITGEEPAFFSFPVGQRDCISDSNLQEAKKHYRAVFSAYGGYNFPGNKNSFYFQRFSNPLDLATFRAILAGVHRFRPFYVNHDSEV